MKFEIAFEQTYSHPLQKVWRALTDRILLGQWLMETDFAPELGGSFQMLCRNERGSTDRYLCKIVEYEPPRRMVWSWIIDERQSEGEMYVEFTLEEVLGGTHLTIRHSGDRDAATIEAFKGGWPVKLENLDRVISLR